MSMLALVTVVNEDVASAMERLLDPTDPVLDWDEVRDRLLDSDQAQRSMRTGACAPPRP